MPTLFAVFETLPIAFLVIHCLFLVLLGAYLYVLHTDKSPTLKDVLTIGIWIVSILSWWAWGFSLIALVALILLNVLLSNHAVSTVAKQDVQKQKTLWLSPYESVEMSLESFPWLDAEFYQESQRELESLDFYLLVESELLHHTRAYPNMRTLFRTFVLPDDDIYVSTVNLKYIKPRNKHERNFCARVVEFTTEFSDGTFLDTNNLKGLSAIEEVEGFTIQLYPPETPIKTLLEHHVQKRDQLCAEGNLDTYIIATKEDKIASASREHAIMAKDRLAKGFFTDEEYRRIGIRENLNTNVVEQFLKAHRKHADAEKNKIFAQLEKSDDTEALVACECVDQPAQTDRMNSDRKLFE